MMASSLKSVSEGETLILTLSDPEARNTLNPEIYAAGVEALNAAENNAGIRSVVITGDGAMFCVGGDLKRLQANRQEAPEVQAQSIDALHNWIDSIRTFPKPVIAAVEGAAAGAGFSLVLACDFVVAASNAVFIMSYSNVGLSPDGGASYALAQALPRALTTEILMLGGRVTAQRLHDFGLVNRVCQPRDALADSLRLALELNGKASNALASIKELVNDAASNSLSAQLASERDHFVRNLHHGNGAEGLEAFLQKRTPHYR